MTSCTKLLIGPGDCLFRPSIRFPIGDPRCLCLLCHWLLAGTAQAQNFPSRPLRLIVGYTAGGAVDIGEMLTATTEQWAAMLSSEKNRYEKLIREARIQPD